MIYQSCSVPLDNLYVWNATQFSFNYIVDYCYFCIAVQPISLPEEK